MLKSAIALLLLSLKGSQAAHIGGKLHQRAAVAAQTKTTRTCSWNIDNFKDQRSLDWQSIASQTGYWTDPQAPSYNNKSNTNDELWWSGASNNEDGIQTWGETIYWLHAMTTTALPDASIYGDQMSDNFNDIKQGALGDCYYLAGISALAENAYRLDQAIETDSINAAGIFTMRVYIRGVPGTISVDDQIAFKYSKWSGYYPMFAKAGDDHSIWGMLMEKVWAKVNGNYEFTIGGMAREAFDLLGGSPSAYYGTQDKSGINGDANAAYEVIDNANKKNYMMSAGCCQSGTDYSAKDLYPGHAYTAVGAVTVTQGGVDVQLILVRNPWGTQTYSGPWGPTDTTNWNAETTPQAPQYGQNSGNFYMTASDFVKYFDDVSVGYFVDTYVNNFLEVTMCDAGDEQARTYYLTFDEDAGESQLGVQFYNDRMYPQGCDNWNSWANVMITSPSGSTLYNYNVGVNNGAGFQYFDASSLEAGQYTMTVTMHWTSGVDVPDYTVRAYTDQVVHIEAQTGEVGSYNYAMDKRNNTVSTSAPTYTPVTTCVDTMEVSLAPNNTYLAQELADYVATDPTGSSNGYWTTTYSSGATTVPGTSGSDVWIIFEGKSPYLSTITLTFPSNGGLYATTGASNSCTGDATEMVCVCKVTGGETCGTAIQGWSGWGMSASIKWYS